MRDRAEMSYLLSTVTPYICGGCVRKFKILDLGQIRMPKKRSTHLSHHKRPCGICIKSILFCLTPCTKRVPPFVTSSGGPVPRLSVIITARVKNKSRRIRLSQYRQEPEAICDPRPPEGCQTHRAALLRGGRRWSLIWDFHVTLQQEARKKKTFCSCLPAKIPSRIYSCLRRKMCYLLFSYASSCTSIALPIICAAPHLRQKKTALA